MITAIFYMYSIILIAQNGTKYKILGSDLDKIIKDNNHFREIYVCITR